MANKVIVLALLLVAIVGVVSAASPTPAASSPAVTVEGPANNDTIGTDDGDAAAAPGTDGEVVPGPLGSTSVAGGPSAESPTSGATALKVSAVAGIATVAGYFFL